MNDQERRLRALQQQLRAEQEDYRIGIVAVDLAAPEPAGGGLAGRKVDYRIGIRALAPREEGGRQ